MVNSIAFEEILTELTSTDIRAWRIPTDYYLKADEVEHCFCFAYLHISYRNTKQSTC